MTQMMRPKVTQHDHNMTTTEHKFTTSYYNTRRPQHCMKEQRRLAEIDKHMYENTTASPDVLSSCCIQRTQKKTHHDCTAKQHAPNHNTAQEMTVVSSCQEWRIHTPSRIPQPSDVRPGRHKCERLDRIEVSTYWCNCPNHANATTLGNVSRKHYTRMRIAELADGATRRTTVTSSIHNSIRMHFSNICKYE